MLNNIQNLYESDTSIDSNGSYNPTKKFKDLKKEHENAS